MSKTYLGDKDVFSANLVYYIETHKVTQREVAKSIGVTESSITDWITKRHYPRLDKIQLLAEFFGIQMTDLVEPREEKPVAAEREITEKEQLALELFHKIPDDRKEFFIKMLQLELDSQ